MTQRPAVWLRYHGETKINVDDCFGRVTAAEICAPHPWAGRTIYRYALSRNTFTAGVWADKNPRARIFERRYFTTRQEAMDALKAAAPTFGVRTPK